MPDELWNKAPPRKCYGILSIPTRGGLIASRPVPGERRRRLYSIPGQVPDLAALPAGCAFAGRCERATARCREAIPPLLGDRQRAACFYSEFAEVTA